MRPDKAIRAVNKAGSLLVFPVKNGREPPSLWHALYPRSKMTWDWGEAADDRVVNLWHLRTALSLSRDVVYSKWFKNRATLVSRPLFAALVKVRGHEGGLGEESRALYRLLGEDSPQTARMLRRETGLLGKEYESAFNRALRPLWERFLVVGFGEIDEGSYPSLAMGATKTLLEDLWDEAQALAPSAAWARIDAAFPLGSVFRQWLERLQKREGA